MFVTKVTCPQCNGDKVCIEVIKSKIFPDGKLACAGWVDGEAVAYCYTCDEAKLTQRAKKTAEDKLFLEAEEACKSKGNTKPAKVAAAPIFNARPERPMSDNSVDEQILAVMLSALERGVEILHKTKNWHAEHSQKYWQNLSHNWPIVRRQAEEMISSKLNFGMDQINALRNQLK